MKYKATYINIPLKGKLAVGEIIVEAENKTMANRKILEEIRKKYPKPATVRNIRTLIELN